MSAEDPVGPGCIAAVAVPGPAPGAPTPPSTATDGSESAPSANQQSCRPSVQQIGTLESQNVPREERDSNSDDSMGAQWEKLHAHLPARQPANLHRQPLSRLCPCLCAAADRANAHTHAVRIECGTACELEPTSAAIHCRYEHRWIANTGHRHERQDAKCFNISRQSDRHMC
eukprot:3932939-Rhodomonas_salina.3